MLRLDQGEEDEVLSQEARRGRNPGQRQKEDHHQNRRRGTLVHQAGHVINFIADQITAAHCHHDGERAHIHEGIHEKINGDSLEARVVARHQAEQDVADVRDGGIGEQPLDVRLADRGQVSERHRGHGHADQQRQPLLARRSQRKHKHAQEKREGGRLRAYRHERRDRSRRALVGVGQPLVKRHRANLKEKPGRHRDDREQDHRIPRGPLRDREGNLLQVRRIAKPVEKRHPVRQNPG